MASLTPEAPVSRLRGPVAQLNGSASLPFEWRTFLSRSAIFPWCRAYAHALGRAHFVLEDLGEFLYGNVLDVGCGSNAVLFQSRLGSTYHGLDLSSSYKIQRERPETRLDSVVDLEREPLPFGDQSFDTVICTDVLEHLDNIHQAYDELFRVARKAVIVSLPNNWPGWLGSLLAGCNVSHRAGYGLSPEPKAPGHRHKYFFNLEEACDFLVGRTPTGYRVRHIELRFDRGNDGLIHLYPFGDFFRRLQAATLRRTLAHPNPAKGFALLVARWLVYVPTRCADIAFTSFVWGWGSPVRFYNLFCRQIWVVFERTEEEDNSRNC